MKRTRPLPLRCVPRLLAAATLLGMAACDAGAPPAEAPAAPASPREPAPAPADPLAAFAPPESCGPCHANALAAWTGSHHDRAMERPTPGTVLGDFDDARFQQGGTTTHFRRDGERFVVETEGPDGERGRYEVAFTFGVHPLQQYLIAFPGGRLQSLTIAWDVEAKRWFSLYPDETIAADDPLHWTGRLQRWNVMCADCHSTALHGSYDVDAERYETDQVAIDVSCQACHGPAAAHVDWARSLEPGAPVPAEADRRLSGQLARATPEAEVDTCAPCHSHRRRISARAVPGEPFLDHYEPSRLRADLYHDDGQIDAEVYVYGSFLQSLMHRRGVRCSDCHDPHRLTLRAEGNDLCTRCHAATPDPRFPTLAARDYDTADHHFHAPGSSGAACVACHMPAKTYMQVDPRRDHSLRVPRPDLTLAIGTPNACDGCHADRGAEWAAGFLAARGAVSVEATHWAGTVAAARRGEEGAGARLADLVRDADLPGIVRATAVSELPRFAAEHRAILKAARDPDPLVRVAAAEALQQADPPGSAGALGQLAADERRAVRVAAALALSLRDPGAVAAGDRAAYRAALDEFRATQKSLSDTPESHLNLGGLSERRGRPGAAEAAYRTALRVGPDFLPAAANLSNLLNRRGRNEEAEQVLRGALVIASRRAESEPGNEGLRGDLGQVHYSLGLLLAELGRIDDAERELSQAAERLPDRPRVHYNHGLALQQLGRRDEALAALERAEALLPGDPAVQHALAVYHAQGGDRELAVRHARRSLELSGGSAAARELLRQVEAMPAR